MGHKVENTSLTPTVFKKEAYAVKFPLPVCMCVQERERENGLWQLRKHKLNKLLQD